jgi:thymidylate synthase (FAD)
MKVVYIDHMGDDTSVVKAARVSFAQDGEVRSVEDNTKLINYLAKHRHWTPFSHTSITLRMTAPIPIRTQAFKHKVGFSENEESRRYVSYEPEYFIPEFRESCDNKKQGSGGSHPESNKIQDLYKVCMEYNIRLYKNLLDKGVAEEQARFVLPQGCMVNWYWTGSLSAFARFYKQRSDSHAQKEIQELAKMVADTIQPLYPISWKALTEDKT